jgi:hypothetical protein
MGGRKMNNTPIKTWLAALAAAALLAFTMPGDAFGKTKQQAAQQAARQHNAKVLSVKTEQQGNRKVYVVKLLTKDGVVKTVRVSAD